MVVVLSLATAVVDDPPRSCDCITDVDMAVMEAAAAVVSIEQQSFFFEPSYCFIPAELVTAVVVLPVDDVKRH